MVCCPGDIEVNMPPSYISYNGQRPRECIGLRQKAKKKDCIKYRTCRASEARSWSVYLSSHWFWSANTNLCPTYSFTVLCRAVLRRQLRQIRRSVLEL